MVRRLSPSTPAGDGEPTVPKEGERTTCGHDVTVTMDKDGGRTKYTIDLSQGDVVKNIASSFGVSPERLKLCCKGKLVTNSNAAELLTEGCYVKALVYNPKPEAVAEVTSTSCPAAELARPSKLTNSLRQRFLDYIQAFVVFIRGFFFHIYHFVETCVNPKPDDSPQNSSATPFRMRRPTTRDAAYLTMAGMGG